MDGPTVRQHLSELAGELEQHLFRTTLTIAASGQPELIVRNQEASQLTERAGSRATPSAGRGDSPSRRSTRWVWPCAASATCWPPWSPDVGRALLTPQLVDAQTDAFFRVARRNMLNVGHVTEALLLMNAKGRARLVTNLVGDPFNEQEEDVQDEIRRCHAKAAVHVAPYRASWLRELATAGGYAHRLAANDPSRLVIAVGHWPARSHTHVRMAEVIEIAGTRDLIELKVPGLTAASWLERLLPH